MLGNNYIKINNTAYTPSSFSMAPAPVENTMVAQSGKDLVVAVRLDKMKFKASWRGITYNLMTELESYTKTMMVILEWKGTSYECRAREASADMIDWSWKYQRSDGLWDYSMTLTEL